MTELWERQPEEPALWFERFQDYLTLGPERTMMAVYRRGQQKAGKGSSPSLPGAWARMTAAWQWPRRAEAHDAMLARRALIEYEAERIQERLNRRQTMKALRGKLLTRLNGIPLEEIDIHGVVNGLKVVTQELRKEYDDEPKTRTETSLVDERPPNPFEGMSDDELEAEIDRLARLHGPARRALPGAGAPPPGGPAPDDPGRESPDP